ncbi:ATP-binding protein [Nocardia sp. NPDC101769]|uniref:ATP-binding protein n=1 Tax=Nocardia sp. NPDC101769 TaxID=3364333 RepID=UPI003828F3E1
MTTKPPVRGRLRIYLGAAPGVGKTYKALEEARRRAGRGTDVVLGLVETHGREHTAALLDDLELIPRKTLWYKGFEFTEMDIDAILVRRPAVVVVDELAHTNVPGSRNRKRWQDIDELLAAGITVLSTLNIQHLESLNDVITGITGVVQRETVPDAVVRAAEQVELVDMTAEALRRRLEHGNVYPAAKIDASLHNYFRTGNLTALRELALLWVADQVDDQLDAYRAEHNITRTWEARERIVVALTGGPEGDTIVRRAARIAGRTTGADLLAVHVTRSDGLVDAGPDHLARQRRLVEELGGSYHQVIGNDIPTAILDFARGVNATQLVLGASRRGPISSRLSAGVGATISVRSDAIDVHLVPHEATRTSRRSWRTPPALSMRRRLIGLATALAGLPAVLAAALAVGLPLAATIVLLFGAVITVALIGGLYPAAVAALGGFALLDYYLIPPKHSLAVGDRGNLLALVIFLVVAVAVSATVEMAARRTAEAARAHAESDTLSTVAGSVLRGDAALPALLERVRETFGMQAVTLLERHEDSVDDPDLRRDPDRWRIVATTGGEPCTAPACGDVEVPADDRLTLVLRGRRLDAADQRVAAAFAVQAAVALRQQRLAEQAAAVAPLTETDRMRTALLAAVGHDLRTPLAGAMAAVTSMQDTSVEFSPEDRAQLLDAAGESLTRLDRLVTNLLDMSRLQAGVIGVHLEELALEEVLPRALDDLDATDTVTAAIDPELPLIRADSVLLERVLVNLVANALRYSPADRHPSIFATAAADGAVRIHVIDHGPGIDPMDYDRVFLPFQRLGDRHNGNGVGLGLALARGLAEAMGATITPEATPGGGLTMTVILEGAPQASEAAIW